ncbi:hypothetical protein K7X08_037951 [Anisodus acutangulus]|uniref:Mechanosensitive ion channel protein n=1 Tax=Anisodus acutangulus TaxID=402998 RepID=A0A9Q1MXE7_9SOLA|nr:hypothetical protein K7X08_037951 [Anisodus acutangulus]
MPEDPPSRLIGQFLNKQRAVGCEMTLDMDELRNNPKLENDHSAAGSSPLNFPPDYKHNHRYMTSKDLRASFQAPSPPSNVVDIEPDQPYNNDKEYCSTDEEDDGETSESTPDEQKYLSRRRTINMNNPPDDTNNSNNTYYTPKNGLSDNDQLVKTLMVKVLASSFHVSIFFDRIQESLFNQYVIETLSGPPLLEIHRSQEEEDRTMAEVWKLQNIAGAQLPPELRPPVAPQYSSKGASVNGGQTPTPKPSRTVSIAISGISGPLSKNPDEQNQGISIDHLHKLNPKNISAWHMKRLIKIVRYGVISTLDEQILDTKTEDDSTTQIRSEYEAKVAARKIFRNVAKPRSKFIYLDDLSCFLREEEALTTMNLVEGSPDRERISRASLKNLVVNAFRERRAFALTLNDTKTAVNKLHQMVNVLVSVIILLICLVILGNATSKFLLFISSQVVVVAFVFGNTCKTVFESIIFLFVMHPFDVGDRCEVDGVQLYREQEGPLVSLSFGCIDELRRSKQVETVCMDQT